MDRALVAVALVAVVFVAAALIRRRGRSTPGRIDPVDVGAGAGEIAVVGFSTPYCLPCQRWEAALAEAGLPFTKIDVGERPELARKYAITATPVIVAVRRGDGEVLAAFTDDPLEGDVARVADLARGPAAR
jgi:hypothetical protein